MGFTAISCFTILAIGCASGGYGSPSIIVDRAKSKDQSLASGEASPTEWRTPPLWGVANSGPYLHDGRAETLDEAIRLHGGEAAATSEALREAFHGRSQRVDSVPALAYCLCTPDEA